MQLYTSINCILLLLLNFLGTSGMCEQGLRVTLGFFARWEMLPIPVEHLPSVDGRAAVPALLSDIPFRSLSLNALHLFPYLFRYLQQHFHVFLCLQQFLHPDLPVPVSSILDFLFGKHLKVFC